MKSLRCVSPSAFLRCKSISFRRHTFPISVVASLIATWGRNSSGLPSVVLPGSGGAQDDQSSTGSQASPVVLGWSPVVREEVFSDTVEAECMSEQ